MSAAALPPLSRRDLRRRELGARMLAAAEALLADGTTFTELRVEDLITTAGVSRSTFYKTFEGKSDLLLLWLAEIVDGLESAGRAWFSLDASSTREDLAAALGSLLAAYAPHAELMAAAYDLAPADPAVGAHVGDMVARGSQGMREHFERGLREGWVDPQLDPADAARWLTAMTERGFLLLNRLDDPVAARRHEDALADLVWHAVYAPARG